MENLHIPITGDSSNFRSALQSARDGVRQTAKQIEDSGMTIEQMFDRIKVAAAASLAGFSVKEFASKVMEVRGEFQKLEVAFNTMLGSAEKADALMQQLVRTAAITPFDLKGVADGAKQLMAYGIAADEVNDTLIHLGDIAAGLSLPLGDLVYLYGTTMAQGRMFTQDLRQFMGRGIPLAEELAKQFGVTKDKVGELVTAGKVGAEEFKKAIMSMSSEGGRFGGLMEEQSKTITGQISNIEDAIDVMFNNIGKQSEGIINGALSAISSLVENYETVGRVIMGLVVTYGVYKTAVMTVTALESFRTKNLALQAVGLQGVTAAEAIHYHWLVLTQKAQALLNATMLANPYVAVAAAVAGIVTIMWALHDSTTAQERAQKTLNKTLDDLTEQQKKYNQETEEAIRLAESDTAATSDRDGAMQLLIQRYPEIIQKYIDEEGHLRDILKLKKEIAEIDGQRQRNEKTKKLENTANESANLAVELNRLLDKQMRANSTYTDNERQRLNEIRKLYKEQTGKGFFDMPSVREMRDYYDKLAKEADKAYRRNLTENRITDFTKEGGKLEGFSDAQLRVLQKRLQDAQAKDKKNMSVFIAELQDYLTYDDRADLLTRITGMIEARNQPKSKVSEQKEAARKALEEAKKALADFDASDNLLTVEAAQREREKLQKAVKEAEDVYKKYGGDISKKTSEAAEEANRLAQQGAKYTEEARKQQLVRERAAKDLELSTRQAEIDAMKESSEKTVKQLTLDFEKRREEIERGYEDLKQQKIEAAKKLWEANPSNKGKVFDASTVDTTYSTKEMENRQKQLDAAFAAYVELLNREEQANRDAINAYLKQYGDYAQKKQAINESANDRICELEEQLSDDMTSEARQAIEARIALIHKETDAQIEELDQQYGKAKQFMIDLFGDASKKSVAEIEKIIKKYEELEKFLQGDSTVTRKDLVSLGFTNKELDQALDKLSQGKITVKDYTDALKNMRGELAERSPWQKFKKDIGDAVDMLKAANGDNTKIGTAITNIGKACSDYMPEVERFSSAIYNLFGVDDKGARSAISAMQGLSKAAEGVGQIVSGQWMDGVVNAVDGVSQAFNGLADMIDDIGSRRDLDAEFNKIELKAIRKAVDKIVDKFEGDSMSDAIRDYEEAMRLYTESLEKAQQNVQDAFSKSSSNIAGRYNHHSINYYMNEIGSKDDINKINELLGVNLDSFSELWFLSPDQLAEVEEKLPHVFAIIEKGIEEMSENASASSDDEDARAMLEAYMELVGKKKEIEEAFTLKMTGTTVTSVKSDFKNMLSDMTSDAETFSEHFEEMIRNSVINALMSDKYNAALEEWYQLFSSYYQNDSKLGEDEIADLRERYKQISDEAIAERDALVNAMADAEETMASSFDSLRSSFRSALLDMKGDTREWGKNIAQIMTEALVDRFVLGEDFDKWLNEWAKSYESIANATFKNKNDGTFLSTNPEEIEAEKARLQEIVDMWGWLADRPIEMMTRDAIMLEHREEAIAALEALAKLNEYETYTEEERAAAIAELNNQLQKEMDLRKQMAKVYADMTGWTLWQKIDASPLANIGDELISALQDTSKGVEDWKKEIVDSLTNDLIKQIVYNDSFKEQIQALQERYVALFEPDEEGNKLTPEQIAAEIEKIASELTGMMTEAEKQVEGIKTIIPDIDTSPFENVRDTFLDTLTDIEGDAEKFKEDLVKILTKDLIEKLVLDVPLTLDVTRRGEDGTIGKIEGKAYDNFNAYSDDWNKAYLDGMKELQEAQKALNEARASGDEEAIAAAEAHYNAASAYIDTLIDELVALEVMTAEEAKKFTERMKKAAQDTTFTDMEDNFVSALMDMEGDVKSFANDIKKIIVQKLVEAFMVSEKIKSLLDDLQNTFNYAMGLTFEGLSTEEATKERAKVINDGYTDENGKEHKGVNDIADELEPLKLVVNELLTAMGYVAKEGETLFSNLGDTILESLLDVGSGVEGLMDSITQTITEDLVKSYMATDEFQDGLKTVKDDLEAAVKALADAKTPEEIAAAEEQLKNAKKAAEEFYNEAVDGTKRFTDALRKIETDTTFKNMTDGWVSNLMDFNATAEDWAEEIGRTMAQRIIQQMIVPTMIQPFLDSLNDAFNAAMVANTTSDENGNAVYHWEGIFDNEGLKAALDALMKQYPEAREAVQKIMSLAGLKPETSNALDSLGDALIDRLLSLDDDVEEIGKQIGQTLIREMLQQMLATGGYADQIAKFKEIWQNILTSDGGQWTDENGMVWTLETLLAGIAKLEDDIAKDASFSTLIDKAKEFGSAAKEGFSDLRGAFVSALLEMNGDAESFGKQIGRTMLEQMLDAYIDNKWKDEIKALNQEWAEALESGNTEAIEHIKQKVKQLYEAIGNDVEVIDIAAAIKELDKQLDTTFSDMADSWASALMDMEGTAEDWAQSVGKMIAEKIIKSMVIPTMIQPLLNDMQKAWNAAAEQEGATYQTMLDAMMPYLSDLVGAYEELRPIADYILNSLGVYKEVVEELKEEVEYALQDMKDNFVSDLMDMEATAEKRAESISRIIAENFIKNFELGDAFDAQMEQWQQHYESILNSGLSEDERARQLKLLRDAIASAKEGYVEQAMAIQELLGLNATNSNQTATANIVDKITYEQADMGLGMLMALVMNSEQMLATVRGGVTVFNGGDAASYQAKMATANGEETGRQIESMLLGLANLNIPDGDTVREIRGLIIIGNSYLYDIKTSNEQMLRQFGERLESIDNKIGQIF